MPITDALTIANPLGSAATARPVSGPSALSKQSFQISATPASSQGTNSPSGVSPSLGQGFSLGGGGGADLSAMSQTMGQMQDLANQMQTSGGASGSQEIQGLMSQLRSQSSGEGEEFSAPEVDIPPPPAGHGISSITSSVTNFVLGGNPGSARSLTEAAMMADGGGQSSDGGAIARAAEAVSRGSAGGTPRIQAPAPGEVSLPQPAAASQSSSGLGVNLLQSVADGLASGGASPFRLDAGAAQSAMSLLA